jgi:hypothetical protein
MTEKMLIKKLTLNWPFESGELNLVELNINTA